MKQYLKDNFGLITVSIETTIRDLEDFLESAKDIDLKDSPQQAIRRTIDIYKDILSDLRTDSVTEIDEKQLKALLNHRLRVLKSQKEKVDLTIPLVEKLINQLNS